MKNRGIGRVIVKKLASGDAGPLVLYAASRTEARTGQPVAASSATVKVYPARLSLTDPTSIDALAAQVRDAHGVCDILINNAGVYYYDEDATAAQRKDMYDTNFYGTMRVSLGSPRGSSAPPSPRSAGCSLGLIFIKMCQAFIPIMQQGGRIVNLSSQSGQLRYMAPHLRARFLARNLTFSKVGELLSEYEVSYASSLYVVSLNYPPTSYIIPIPYLVELVNVPCLT